jgi:hypothetical protein
MAGIDDSATDKIVVPSNTLKKVTGLGIFEKIYNEAELTRLTLDNSILNVFATCPRKFLYRKILNLVPLKSSPALSFGTAFHAGLEAYYTGLDAVSVLKAFADAARLSSSSLAHTRKDAKEKGMKEEHSLEFGLDLMMKYMDRYPLIAENFRIMQTSDGKPMLEKGFALYLHNGILIGKMDGVTDLGDLLENKTTSAYISPEFLAQYTVNNQVSLYLAALRDLLGRRPTRCLMNIIMVKDYKKQTEQQDAQLFRRCVVSRTDSQLDQTIRQLEFRINQVKNFLRIGFDAFYQNAPDACTFKWNTCEYMPLCQSQEADLIEMIWHGNYKEEEWIPYDLEGANVEIEIEAREV